MDRKESKIDQIPSRRALRFFVFLLAAALALVLPALGLKAQEPSPIIRISPAMQTVAAGTDVVVDVVIEDAPSLGAYEFHLGFDPNALSFVSVSGAETFLESTGRNSICLGPDAADLDDAIISFACGSTGAADGPSGDGVLATITFATSCAATSDLAFVALVGEEFYVEPVSLSGVLGSSISTRNEGGAVTVTGGAACPTSPALPGDASCNERIDSIDAALVLQRSAGLLRTLSCEENADVNQNGSIDSIDAALILQFVAGLIRDLPP